MDKKFEVDQTSITSAKSCCAYVEVYGLGRCFRESPECSRIRFTEEKMFPQIKFEMVRQHLIYIPCLQSFKCFKNYYS